MSKVAYLEDEGIKVARDMVKGATWIHRTFVGTVTGTEQTVWFTGGLYQYPNTANNLVITSSSASDTSGSTGARTISIEGLDSDYNTISETVTMNGTNSIVTTNAYFRLQRASVSTAGSSETNVGNITLTQQGSNYVLGKIDADAGQTQFSVYTIPKGKTAYLVQLDLTSSKNTDGRIMVKTRLNGVRRVRHSVYLFGGSYDSTLPYPTVFFEKTDVELRTIALTGTGHVTGNYDLLIVDNAQ